MPTNMQSQRNVIPKKAFRNAKGDACNLQGLLELLRLRERNLPLTPSSPIERILHEIGEATRWDCSGAENKPRALNLFRQPSPVSSQAIQPPAASHVEPASHAAPLNAGSDPPHRPSPGHGRGAPAIAASWWRVRAGLASCPPRRRQNHICGTTCLADTGPCSRYRHCR